MSEHDAKKSSDSSQSLHTPSEEQIAPTLAAIDFVAVRRAVQLPNRQTLTPRAVLQLQRTFGNQAVMRLIQRQKLAISTAPQNRIQRLAAKHKKGDTVKVFFGTQVKTGTVEQVTESNMSLDNQTQQEALTTYRIRFADNTTESVAGFRVYNSYMDDRDVIDLAVNAPIEDYSEKGIHQALGFDQPAQYNSYEFEAPGNKNKPLPLAQRPTVKIVMNQAHVNYLNQVVIWNNEALSSCSLIVMYNSSTQIGALYHFPGRQVQEERHKIETLFEMVQPTYVKLIHAVDRNDDFGKLDVLIRKLGGSPESAAGSGVLGITLSASNQLEIVTANNSNNAMSLRDYKGGLASFY